MKWMTARQAKEAGHLERGDIIMWDVYMVMVLGPPDGLSIQYTSAICRGCFLRSIHEGEPFTFNIGTEQQNIGIL